MSLPMRQLKGIQRDDERQKLQSTITPEQMKFYNTTANINDNIYCDKNMIQSLTKILNFQTSKVALYV